MNFFVRKQASFIDGTSVSHTEIVRNTDTKFILHDGTILEFAENRFIQNGPTTIFSLAKDAVVSMPHNGELINLPAGTLLGICTETKTIITIHSFQAPLAIHIWAAKNAIDLGGIGFKKTGELTFVYPYRSGSMIIDTPLGEFNTSFLDHEKDKSPGTVHLFQKQDIIIKDLEFKEVNSLEFKNGQVIHISIYGSVFRNGEDILKDRERTPDIRLLGIDLDENGNIIEIKNLP